jgi:hypothetical protein
LEAGKLRINQLLPSTPAVLSCPQTAEALVLAPGGSPFPSRASSTLRIWSKVSLKEAALSVDTTKHTTVPNYSGTNLRRPFQIFKNSGDMWVKLICCVKTSPSKAFEMQTNFGLGSADRLIVRCLKSKCIYMLLVEYPSLSCFFCAVGTWQQCRR